MQVINVKVRGRSAALIVFMLACFVLPSVLVPRSASASSQATVRQGLFYDTPTDGASASTVAERAELVVFTRGKINYVKDLRQRGFDGVALQYIVANEVIGPGPYRDSSAACDRSFAPTNNNVAHQVGDFCTYLHPNESWFLHNSRGERLYSWSGRGVAYHMNPGSSGWREFARTRIVRDLVGDSAQAKIGYDGIFLDNLALGTYKLRQQLGNSDGTVKEYSSNSAYRTAVVEYAKLLGERIRPAGPLWANLIDDFEVTAPEYLAYVDALDGFMNEAWAAGYLGRQKPTVQRWNEMLSIAETALSKGKGVLGVVQGSKTDYARQRFGLASYLLMTDNSRAVMRYADYRYYNEWWQYDNYGVALGAPKGGRYQVGTTWRRDFECGYAIANPETQQGEVVQTSCASLSASPTPSPTASPSPSPSPTPAPPASSARITLPARIEAENYRSGGQGAGYYDTTPGNAGGSYRNDDVDIHKCADGSGCLTVGYVKAGEWLAYDVTFPQSGNYVFKVRTATPYTGRRLRIRLNGVDVTGPISVKQTSSWDHWADTWSGTVAVTAGDYTLQLVADTDATNLNFVEVVRK